MARQVRAENLIRGTTVTKRGQIASSALDRTIGTGHPNVTFAPSKRCTGTLVTVR